MNNLIFVAKDIGLECLKFHLETFSCDQNRIIVSELGRAEIEAYLANKKVQYEFLEDFSEESVTVGEYDWLLNLWGGYIFRDRLIKACKHSLNIHPSYLPYGRGRDPVVWAIRDQAPVGITLHEINEGVDEGNVWYRQRIHYQLPITGKELYDKVVSICTKAFKENWSSIRSLDVTSIPQSELEAVSSQTRKRKDLYNDQLIKFNLLEDKQKDILLKILAHDFGESYSAILEINDATFKINLNIERIDNE